MISLMAIALLAIAVQSSDLPSESETICRVTLPGGEVRYGAVRETGQQVTVIFDEPWAPSKPANYARGRVEFQPEPKVARAERLEAEGRRAGYVQHKTADGPRWVKEEDLRYFNRAKAMLAKAPASETAASTASVESPPTQRPGMSAQWGLHVLVLAVGAALASLLWKRMQSTR